MEVNPKVGIALVAVVVLVLAGVGYQSLRPKPQAEPPNLEALIQQHDPGRNRNPNMAPAGQGSPPQAGSPYSGR